MSLSVGIIGLPNAGKSTLFNALMERQHAVTGKHPFTTVEPNTGTVDVPSKRLVNLSLLVQEKGGVNVGRSADVKRKRPTLARTPVKLTFVDIAGLIRGAHQGEGLGNQFLHHIREVDCVLHVVREFEDETVPHIHAEIDPDNDIEIVHTELVLKDLETVEGQLEKKNSGWVKEFGEVGVELLKKLKRALDKGVLIRDMGLNGKQKKIIEGLCLLTEKPEVVVRNRGEEVVSSTSGDPLRVTPDALQICARVEEELAGLPWVERQQYLKEFGLPEPALNRVIRACYQELDLITFYTIAGGKETRAWALEQGSSVYEAAGKIHTDMQKGFIKAEIISADILLDIGSWQEAKKKGRVELVGRDYVVKDHDVVEIKFN